MFTLGNTRQPVSPRLSSSAMMLSVALAAGLSGCIASPEPTVEQIAQATQVPDISGVWKRPYRDEEDPRLQRGETPEPPLKPEYKSPYEQLRADMKAAEERGEPIDYQRAACVPDGMPRIMNSTMPVEILQDEDKIVLIAEFQSQIRRIYISDEPLPAPEDIEPTFFGTSIGRWNESVLEVTTAGLQTKTPLFDYVPHSASVTFHETFEFLEPDLLLVTMTVEDPEYLEAPWTVQRKYVRQTDDMRMREFVCQENNRSLSEEFSN